ncbi:MAG: DUF1638 domain-containing protein [Methanomassiliicoccales archaeon]|nr:DUF1638 domain-containing protein [Methanomassiliicoccales archaeon]
MSRPAGSRTLAIVGCRLFEDELVHVLVDDNDISEVFVVDDQESKDLRQKLAKKGIHVRITQVAEAEISRLERPDGFSVLVWVKPMALHQKPEKLKEDVIGTVGKLESVSDAVLLFYGLCGNAFRHVDRDTSASQVPVVILRDEKKQIVDDCIGCVLGGTDEYLAQLRKSIGTFFLTPMWAANWRELFHKVQILQDPNDVEGARYIFKCVGYKKVVKMETGLGDDAEFDERVKEFAQLFDFELGSVKCTLSVVESSYEEAKHGALGHASRSAIHPEKGLG